MRRTIKIPWGNLRVGVVLIFAVAALFYASLSGGGTSIFESKSEFYCYFPDVNGLVKGSPVWMAGVEVGNVRSVKFVFLDSLRRVEVRCRIKEAVWEMMTDDTEVLLGTIGFLGDKYIEVVPGTRGRPVLGEGTVVPTGDVGDARQVLQKGEEAFENVGSLTKSLDEVLGRMNRGEGTLGRISTDTSLYVELTRLTGHLTVLANDLHRNQERLTGSIEKMANSVSDLTDQVQANTGTLGKIVNDPALYDNLAATSARLDTIMHKINVAEGSMGLLVNDTALYVEVVNLLTRVNNLVTDIEENPRKYFKFSVF